MSRKKLLVIMKKPLRLGKSRVRVGARQRTISSREEEGTYFRHQDLEVDVLGHRVYVSGAEVAFTVTEFRILRMLMTQPGRVYSREEILAEAVGRRHTISKRNVDVHVKAIREKLGDLKDLIETVRGVGYRFRDSFLPSSSGRDSAGVRAPSKKA